MISMLRNNQHFSSLQQEMRSFSRRRSPLLSWHTGLPRFCPSHNQGPFVQKTSRLKLAHVGLFCWLIWGSCWPLFWAADFTPQQMGHGNVSLARDVPVRCGVASRRRGLVFLASIVEWVTEHCQFTLRLLMETTRISSCTLPMLCLVGVMMKDQPLLECLRVPIPLMTKTLCLRHCSLLVSGPCARATTLEPSGAFKVTSALSHTTLESSFSAVCPKRCTSTGHMNTDWVVA